LLLLRGPEPSTLTSTTSRRPSQDNRCSRGLQPHRLRQWRSVPRLGVRSWQSELGQLAGNVASLIGGVPTTCTLRTCRQCWAFSRLYPPSRAPGVGGFPGRFDDRNLHWT